MKEGFKNMIQLSEEITKIKGGVSSPKGFEAKGVHCGLRYSKKDLGDRKSVV